MFTFRKKKKISCEIEDFVEAHTVCVYFGTPGVSSIYINSRTRHVRSSIVRYRKSTVCDISIPR